MLKIAPGADSAVTAKIFRNSFCPGRPTTVRVKSWGSWGKRSLPDINARDAMAIPPIKKSNRVSTWSEVIARVICRRMPPMVSKGEVARRFPEAAPAARAPVDPDIIIIYIRALMFCVPIC